MLRFIDTTEKEETQKSGYMCEHLLCFYSMTTEKTALLNETFPVFINNDNEADAIFFGLRERYESENSCLSKLSELSLTSVNTVTPVALKKPNITTRSEDFDYHIDVQQFNFSLKGNKYKRLRYTVKQLQKLKYNQKINRRLTPSHLHILSRHMARHDLAVWDFEELISLEAFFREHNHGFMMEAYLGNRLIGFDVVDFFEHNKIMVVPLGIYAEEPRVSDFLMYENLKYAKENGYQWLDVGLTCNDYGIQRFKEKWMAKPKFKIFVQKMQTGKKATS